MAVGRPSRVPWLFVTGAPRSGTTFVGSMLSRDPRVDYLHEPFNPDCGLAGIPRSFFRPRDADEDAHFRSLMASLRSYDFRLDTAYYPRDRGVRRLVKAVVGSRGRFHLRLAKINVLRRGVVLKDPIGVRLGPLLARDHGIPVVYLVRHPVAFCASVARLGWEERIRGWVDGWLGELEADGCDGPDPGPLRRQAERHPAAVLWRLVYEEVRREADGGGPCLVVKHEAVSEEPLRHLREMAELAGLPFSFVNRLSIRRNTATGNPAEARGGKVQAFRRDSRALFSLRVGQAGREEREEIWRITGSLASRWYAGPESR